MNKETREHLEKTLNDCLDVCDTLGYTYTDDGKNLLDQANQLANTIIEADRLEEEKINNLNTLKKEAIVEIVKATGVGLSAIISAISLKNYVKMILKYEKDGILTSTPGKGLANLFRVKSIM